jgi:hypothetical protein
VKELLILNIVLAIVAGAIYISFGSSTTGIKSCPEPLRDPTPHPGHSPQIDKMTVV